MTGFESYFFSKSNEGKRYFSNGVQGLNGTLRLMLPEDIFEVAGSSVFCVSTFSLFSSSAMATGATISGCILADCCFFPEI